MKYILFVCLISLSYSSAIAQERITESDLVEVVRKAVYHQQYHQLEKYSTEEWLGRLPDSYSSNYLKSLSILVNSLDTMTYPLDTEEKLYLKCAMASIYEIVEENGKRKRNLLRPMRITDWREIGCLGGPYVYSRLDSATVRKIQSKLRKEKWYQGPVDGVLNMPVYFAFKFFNAMVLKDKGDEYSCIMHPPVMVKTMSLVALDIIENPRPIKIIQAVQIALKKGGYEVGEINNIMNEKTKEALEQYQKDNGLPTGQLDIETLKKLDINY